MSSRKPKAYGYVRVSTDQQAERGMGVEIQCDAIDAWARANGFPDGVEEFVYEIGVSGAAPFHERVGIATVLSLLRKGDVRVVARTDRLARDLVAQEMFLGHAWAKGATVASCVETEAAVLRPDDHGDPARKLIRQVLGAVSEYERALIRLRLQAGIKRRKAAEGFCHLPHARLHRDALPGGDHRLRATRRVRAHLPPRRTDLPRRRRDRRLLVRGAAAHRRAPGVRGHGLLHDGQDHHLQRRAPALDRDLELEDRCDPGRARLRLRGFQGKTVVRFFASEIGPLQPEEARFHVLPVPYEKTVSYGNGTAKGPAPILEASSQLERWDGNSDPSKEGIYTWPARLLPGTRAGSGRYCRCREKNLAIQENSLGADGNPANPALTNPTPRMVARTANSAESFSDRIHAGVNECFRFKHGVFVKPVGACNLAVYLTAAPTGYQGS